jgi:predicted MFS family arabinose efflux permease
LLRGFFCGERRMDWLDGWFRDARGLGREFWKFYAAAVCVDIGFAMYVFLYSLFLLDIGFDERQIGLVAGALTIGAMFGTLPAGALAERFGLRPMLLTGFVMTPAICAVRPFFASEHAQIGMAFLTGLFLCTWHVGYCPATAALTTEKNRTFGFSLMFSTGISTGALAGLMGGWLPGWLMRAHMNLHAVDAKRAVLLLCCAVYLLGIWPAWKMRLSCTGERRAPWRFDPFLYRYLPAIALWSLAAGAFVPFAQVFLAHQVHLPLVRIGEVFSAGQILQVVAILMAPIFFRRCGLVAGIAYTQAVSGLALAGLAGAHGVSPAVTLYVAFMAIHWMAGPGIYSLLMDRVQESSRSSASAANIFTTSLCQAVASAATGAAYVHFGYPKVLGGIAAVAVFSSGWFWVLLRDRRPGQAVARATADAN